MIEEYHLTEVSEVLIVQNLGAENSSSSQTDNVKKKTFQYQAQDQLLVFTVPIMQQKKNFSKAYTNYFA